MKPRMPGPSPYGMDPRDEGKDYSLLPGNAKILLLILAGLLFVLYIAGCSTESEYVFEKDTWTVRHKTQTPCTGDDGVESYESDCEQADASTTTSGPVRNKYEGCTVQRTVADDGAEILCPNGGTVVLYDGQDGSSGSDGARGATGSQGASGAAGQPGSAGPAGEPGSDGNDGVDGATGGSCHVSCELRLTGPKRHVVIRCDDGSEVAWKANCTL